VNHTTPHKPINQLVAVIVATLILALLFSGCSSGMFENRVTCTIDGKRAQIVSKWGALGIASELTEADALAICKGQGVKL